MVILIFQRDLCPPLSFPLCPVGRSTAAKTLSLPGGIPFGGGPVPSGSGQLSISLVATSAWKARARGLILFLAKKLDPPPDPTRGIFILKLLVLSILFPQLEQSYCDLVVDYQKDTEGLAMK